jgi:iron complex transport system ATP-binding protein
MALELRNVSARYAGADEPPLRNATLSVLPGDLVAVLGPNGAGKSTLLRVMAGTLDPYEGEALLFGSPMRGMDRRSVAAQVAVVAQEEAITFGFSVRDVVMMGRAPHQGGWLRATPRDQEVVEAALKRCDLVPLAMRPASELSGGERKRVAIARALAQEPKVLLLDEPAAFLDVRHQIELHEMLADEVKRRELACVVVMHDLNAAAQYATRVVLAKGGTLVASGTIEEVMTYQRLRETFDADLYVGVNELTGDRFFLPMRQHR